MTKYVVTRGGKYLRHCAPSGYARNEWEDNIRLAKFFDSEEDAPKIKGASIKEVKVANYYSAYWDAEKEKFQYGTYTYPVGNPRPGSYCSKVKARQAVIDEHYRALGELKQRIDAMLRA